MVTFRPQGECIRPPNGEKATMNRPLYFRPSKRHPRNLRLTPVFVFLAMAWEDDDDYGYDPDSFFDDSGYNDFDDDDTYADDFDEMDDDEEEDDEEDVMDDVDDDDYDD